MSDLRAFMAGNAIAAEEVEILVSKRFVDKKGDAIKWKVKAISSKEDEAIRKSCTVKVAGKRGVKTPETDVNAYLAKMVCACIVYPDLNDKDLQDSYGVMGAAEALKAMLLPGEFSELSQKIQEINGFDTNMEEMVDEAKKLISEGDFEANQAYYCLHKLKILPHEYLALSREERAYIAAAIKIKMENEEKEMKKAKRKR